MYIISGQSPTRMKKASPSTSRADVRLRASIRLNIGRDLLGCSELIVVVTRRVERIVAPLLGSAIAVFEDVARGEQHGVRVLGQRVLRVLEENVLDDGRGLPTGMVAVRSNAAEVVVVHVAFRKVIRRRVALVGTVKPVVVQRAAGHNIVSPPYVVLVNRQGTASCRGSRSVGHTNAESLVLSPKDVVRDCPESRVHSQVDEAIASFLKQA